MAQGSTPSRARGGPPSRPASARRAGREGPSASGSGSGERTPRTPRRATAANASASAPSTSTRLRAQPITEVNSGSSREASPMPLFTPRAPARGPSPTRGSSTAERYPGPSLLQRKRGRGISCGPVGWEPGPHTNDAEGVEESREGGQGARRSFETERSKESTEGVEEKKGTRRDPPGVKASFPPDDADVIYSYPTRTKNPLPRLLNANGHENKTPPEKKARSASVISISCSEDAETPAPRPDVEDANDMLLPLGKEPPRGVAAWL
ncbi:hypothetical protein B0H14DRAFT_1506774 [Mycena olivaceomarginata]|nr:hypothetical protein B0H14DRAFT_1506774 [Mycena olivaceomarginata]